MPTPLQGRVYVVTGAGGAIARPILARLAEAGAKVAVVARTLEHAQAAAQSISDRSLVLPFSADLSRLDDAAALVRAVERGLGPIEGLIHTVGGFAWGPVKDAEPALYDRMFDLNVRTLFYAVKSVLPGMLARDRGFLAGFSSEPGFRGASPNTALYGAAKAAVATFLRSLDGELKGSSVRVAIVYPMGAVDTPQNRRDMPETSPETLIDPDEIAQTIVYAASRSSRGRLLELPVFPPR
ncbi:MAG TPA: SDR family NAD(P)-dependent oxidoreductase [Polyangia bacterium]